MRANLTGLAIVERRPRTVLRFFPSPEEYTVTQKIAECRDKLSVLWHENAAIWQDRDNMTFQSDDQYFAFCAAKDWIQDTTEALLKNAQGGVVSREEVVHSVWPEAVEEGVSEQAIDALVRRLRERLAEMDPDHQYVITVRGHGFRFDNSPATPAAGEERGGESE